MPGAPQGSPSLGTNVKLFLLFRVLFNSRFYYPVFAILFIDFGLTWGDFFLLNAVWAVASIFLEVPSGALADQLGRRTLVIGAAALMVVEMAILCVTPLGGGTLVFVLWLINRVISGAAEASASGADEALAYDSIPEAERETLWPRVQSRLIVAQAIGMIVALNVGATAYRLDAIVDWLGLDWEVDRDFAVRIPIFLCLGTSILTLIVTLMMREPPRQTDVSEVSTVRESFARTVNAGRWIIHHPAPLYILLVLVLYDSIIRLFYTVASSYYRAIEIDPVFYGLIGTMANLAGLAGAGLLGYVVSHRSARFNYRASAALALTGLVGVALRIPVWGFLVIIPLGLAMRHIHAATSHYLNRVTDSTHRATVLSFRGLAMMLFFGAINGLAILQIQLTRPDGAGSKTWDPAFADEIIRRTSPYWWIWFTGVLVFLHLFRRIRFGRSVDEIIQRREKS